MACFPGQPKHHVDDTHNESDEYDTQDDISSSSLKPHSTHSTVKWLENNYHYEDGVCLPRSAIYEHYLDFCQRAQIRPVNAASYGKIIRQQFPNLTTRRLGTRGQSKYHYFGLGIRPTSRYYTQEYNQKQQGQGVAKKEPEQKKTHAYYAAKEKPSSVLPPFPDITSLDLSDSISRDKLHTFMVMYRAHCQRILDSVVRANFNEVENFLLHFWQAMPTHLLPVLAIDVVVDLVSFCDSTLYKVVSNVLIVSPLKNCPESLTQEILRFSNSLKAWLDVALKGLPEPLLKAKHKVADKFVKNLRRQTALMNLAQATRKALRGEDILQQLKRDWCSMDLRSIILHTLFAVQPLELSKHNLELIPHFVHEFGTLLEEKGTVEDFVMWVESIVDKCVRKVYRSSELDLEQVSKLFLLTWKYFTSQVVREFTLQSAPSFGTFHLVHMLIDDYIIHSLEVGIQREQERRYLERMGLMPEIQDESELFQPETPSEDENESPFRETPPLDPFTGLSHCFSSGDVASSCVVSGGGPATAMAASVNGRRTDDFSLSRSECSDVVVDTVEPNTLAAVSSSSKDRDVQQHGAYEIEAIPPSTGHHTSSSGIHLSLPTIAQPVIPNPLIPGIPGMYQYPYGGLSGLAPGQPLPAPISNNPRLFPNQQVMSGYPGPYMHPSFYNQSTTKSFT